jgi:hypothetical protein
MKKILFLIVINCIAGNIFAQSKNDYSTGTESKPSKSGLFDPSKFTIHNSVSFGMASNSGVSNIKSQGLYTTMMQYKFNAPVTLNLNFGLPIFSTASSAQNLNRSNIQSMEYFKSMPFDVSLSWKPLDNMLLQLNVHRSTGNQYFFNDPFYHRDNFYYRDYYRHNKSIDQKDEDK